MKDMWSTRTILLTILASSFAVRLLLILWFKTYASPVPWEFEVITNNLLAGRGYYFDGYYSHAPPLYVFLCAAIYSLTNHSYLVVLIIQSAFSVLLSATVFAITKMLFDDLAGLLASFLIAFHPGFVYYDVFNLIPLSIDAFLISATALLLLKFHYSPTLKKSLLIGVVIGIGTLSRGIIGILFPFVLIYLVIIKTVRFRDRLIFAASMLMAGLVVLMPWMVRNYIVHNQFVFVTSTNTENFWRGNNPYATGASVDENNTSILRLTPIEFRQRVDSMTELQKQRFFRDEALRFIRERPADAMKLYLRKIYYFWWFSPSSGIPYHHNYVITYRIFYAVVLVFCLAGVVLAMRTSRSRTRESCLILLGVALAICLGQSMFYVEGRHRWLIEPILLIFVSVGMVELGKLLRNWIGSKVKRAIA